MSGERPAPTLEADLTNLQLCAIEIIAVHPITLIDGFGSLPGRS
jgi:hypothetical protein